MHPTNNFISFNVGIIIVYINNFHFFHDDKSSRLHLFPIMVANKEVQKVEMQIEINNSSNQAEKSFSQETIFQLSSVNCSLV